MESAPIVLGLASMGLPIQAARSLTEGIARSTSPWARPAPEVVTWPLKPIFTGSPPSSSEMPAGCPAMKARGLSTSSFTVSGLPCQVAPPSNFIGRSRSGSSTVALIAVSSSFSPVRASI